MAKRWQTVEKQLREHLQENILKPRGKPTWVKVTREYHDDSIYVYSVLNAMGESWAIGSMDDDIELPSDAWPRLHWKRDVADLEAAKELGWRQHGYPRAPRE